MKTLIIRHAPFEEIGAIGDWLTEKGSIVETIKTYENQSIPTETDADLLIVMCGPQSVNDELPFLELERQLIRQHVEAGKGMFGVCLGAQQLAKAYGAEVAASPKEVGWAEVTDIQTQKRQRVLHWHGEGFQLPKGSVGLFQSSFWVNQGFRIKNAIGVQFHPEATTELVRSFVENDGGFIEGTLTNQDSEAILAESEKRTSHELLFQLLESLVANNNK